MSARTHLPARCRARVPGGCSAGMMRATRVRGAAAQTHRTSRWLRSFPRAAPGLGLWRGGAWADPRRTRLTNATCWSPGDAALASWIAQRALAWDLGDTATTACLLLTRFAPGLLRARQRWARSALHPHETLGLTRWHPAPRLGCRLKPGQKRQLGRAARRGGSCRGCGLNPGCRKAYKGGCKGTAA